MGEKVHIEQSPSGYWFVSLNGWGRRFDDEAAARAHYDGLVAGILSAI